MSKYFLSLILFAGRDGNKNLPLLILNIRANMKDCCSVHLEGVLLI